VKSLAVVLALASGLGGCTRTTNLYARYGGVVLLVGGAALIVTPTLNGSNGTDPNDPPESAGFNTRPLGIGVAAVGAGLLIVSLLVHPVSAPVSHEAQHQREITLKADALLHDAEAAAGKDDCATVNQLSPQIDQLDPGVGAVLHANVAAARCFAAREKLPMSAWLRHE
jgi:hypothetical protein